MKGFIAASVTAIFCLSGVAEARLDLGSTPKMVEFQDAFSRGCAAVKENCLDLMQDAIDALKYNAPVCEQQHVADRMIDLANSHYFKKQALIDAAKLYRALEKETPLVSIDDKLVDQDSLYCMEYPRNQQLAMINQGQSTESDAKYYYDPAMKVSLEFLAEGTIPRKGSTPGAWIQPTKVEKIRSFLSLGIKDKLRVIFSALGIKRRPYTAEKKAESAPEIMAAPEEEAVSAPQMGIQAFK